MRNAAGELNDLHAANDFAFGVRENFAVLTGDERRQFVVMLVEQRFESEKNRERLSAESWDQSG